MATYAVGDLQGCLDSLMALMDHIAFSSDDRLWLVGDLINRGPKSLETLRFVRNLGSQAVAVLGNHDLHLLAVAHGEGKARGKDTIDDILQAPDRVELLDWMQQLPLLHRDSGWSMVHAGIAPSWSIDDAQHYAEELHGVLVGSDANAFFRSMYGDGPRLWSPELTGPARWRYITNAFTRMRYLHADGALTLKEKGPPASESDQLTPWFAYAGRRSIGENVVFGHWATLQSGHRIDTQYGVFPLDNGCVWGRELTALRLDDRREFNVPAAER